MELPFCSDKVVRSMSFFFCVFVAYRIYAYVDLN